MPIIRKRKPLSDDPHIIRLVRERLFPFALESMPGLKFQQLDVRRRLRRGLTFVADATAGKPPLGFVHIERKRRTLWVDMIAVDSGGEGKGIGSRLLEQGEAYGRRKGCTEAQLYVDRQNHHAQRFYEKHGYSFVKFEPTVNCYLLSKPLLPQERPVFGLFGRFI